MVRWENFYADMGECPKGLSLERKNNERGLVTYEARSYARAIRRITTVAIVATIKNDTNLCDTGSQITKE